MKRRMFIDVRGKRHEWMFTFNGDTEQLDEWRADGLRVYVIENSVPAWVVSAGLLKPWCWTQDFWRLVWR